MDLTEAADAIREKLIEHRISRTANLWSTILKQIRKQDSFDGHYADTILEIIRSFLSRLDDQTAIGLWRTTEAGFADDTEDDCLFPDCIRIDLEMELLKAVTDLAWNEAKESTHRRKGGLPKKLGSPRDNMLIGSADTIPISRHCAAARPWPCRLYCKASISQPIHARVTKTAAQGEQRGDGSPKSCDLCLPRTRPRFQTGPEVRQAGRVTSWRSGERLVANQALSLMKSPQNYRGIPRFFNRRFNLRAELAEAARCRNLNVRLVLSGDDRDRTGNLLVANQALSNRRKLFHSNRLRNHFRRAGLFQEL